MLIRTLTLVAIILLALVARSSGRREAREGGALDALLESGAIVAGIFVVTILTLWYVWAAWNPPPVVHDEMAYVLQAQIFARGKWALASPPLPRFWEQPHVLVEPVLTSKYFPGHSLLLAPGARLGWPALGPLLLQALSASLLFVLARRVANGSVALLAWFLWLSSPMVLYFGPSYYSEATTTVCWLAGWYALLEWRRTRLGGWLLALAAFTGWTAITRPLTGLAYAIPIGIVVLRDIAREKRWRELALAMTMGTAIIGILPLWSVNTTGSWTLTPQTAYTRMYMPYDTPGFGMDSTPPSRSVTPEMVQLNNVYSAAHVTHHVSTLPRTVVDRLRNLAISTWDSTGGILALFAVIGLFALTAESAFAVGSALFLFVAYLSYATPPQWTLYYYESVPALAFLTALGMAKAASVIGRPRGASGIPSLHWRSTRWSRSLLLAGAVLLLPGLLAVRTIRGQHIGDRRMLTGFHALVASIHDERAVLFVRHSPLHNPHVAFVRNTADLERERVWVVYDRGEPENGRLLALTPGRKAYLFDEQRGETYVYEPR